MSSAICIICGSKNFFNLEEINENFKILKCKKCGLVFLYPQPSIKFLKDKYNDEYYKEWLTKQKQEREKLWKKRLKDIIRYKDSGKLLDVGCGDGIFLRLAKRYFNCEGTEISEFACKYVNEKYNLKVYNGEIKDLNLPEKSYDIITMWHVLEHMRDPLSNLKKASVLLKEDGLIVIEVPNLNAYFERFIYFLIKLKKEPLYTERENHLFFFSPETLKKILRKVNFRILSSYPEISQIYFKKKFVEYIGKIFYLMTKINLGSTIRVIACKKENGSFY